MTLLYGAVLVRLAYQAFRLFRESFEIRLQHVDLNQRLTAALDESRIANAAKTRFLAVASHDLRQPVHALALFASSLSRRKLDEPHARNRAAHRHCDRHAVVAARRAARHLAPRCRHRRSRIPLRSTSSRCSRACTSSSTPLADEKTLTVTVSCSPQTVVTTDETLLEQIVRNLLGNAIKYTDSGSIAIVVRDDDERVLLTVKDTGCGIPTEAQQHVFEEFYQVDNPGHDRSRGLGLGLAITKRLVELLGLRLTMQSAVGLGTAFTLELPRAAARSRPASPRAGARGARAQARRSSSTTPPRSARRCGVLLEDFGCRVQLADSTPDAVRVASEARPDIVISDFRLRGDDNGLDTIRQLRELYPGLPAVLVTGDSTPERLRDALEAGVKLLHKPVRPDALVAAIHELCGATSGT